MVGLYSPKQRTWSLESVIPLSSQIVSCPVDREVHENCMALLARDVYSEGDSLPLYDYIIGRQDEMTPAFLEMMKLWYSDEQKHFHALMRVNHIIAGVPIADMLAAYAERVHEIEPIKLVLQDEFTILVALCFDELGSTYSYRRDLMEYYSYYGKEVASVGHHLIADEGTHFGNAVGLLLAHHQHRLGEVPQLLQDISNLESELGTYYKTFFLDHAQETHRFPPDFNEGIIDAILYRLGLRDEAPQGLERLWNWKPDGMAFVPVNV